MNQINSDPRLCENCHRPIPETTRIDAIFCSSRCGWRYRNKIKREKRAEDIKNHPMDPIEKNYGIINFLYQNNSNVVSRQTLREIGFDPDVCSGMRNFSRENHRTEIMIRDYILILDDNELLTIKKQI